MKKVFAFEILHDNSVVAIRKTFICCSENLNEAKKILKEQIEKSSYDNFEILSCYEMKKGEFYTINY